MDEPSDKNKIPAPATPDKTPELQQESPPVPQDAPFFNVMPKGPIPEAGGIVEPTVKVQGQQEAAAAPAGPGIWEKYKLYIILVACVIVFGPLIYYLIGKLGSAAYKPENLLVNKGSQPPPAPQPAPVATTTPQTGFTTSKDWRDKYFPNCTDPKICGDSADPDRDGLQNLQEYQLGTDPNNPDSDQDGLADGDETAVFMSQPSNSHSAGDPKYNDADYIKGGYDFNTGNKMTAQAIAALSGRMQNLGLHQPTLTTLGNILNSLYNFTPPDSSGATSTPVNVNPDASSSTPSSAADQSTSAKQDRDTKRASTIKNIEIALVAYYKDNNSYPPGGDFGAMFQQIKPYLKVATNPQDPVNSDPYVYGYLASADNSDFTLSFYSEAYGQLIKKHAADANADANAEEAAIYDNQRETDLDSLRTALLLYSSSNAAGSQDYVFPTKDKYKTALVPNYISAIPRDPSTGQDYDYEPSSTFNSFTLKATLQDPPSGDTGYMCNQIDDCNYY